MKSTLVLIACCLTTTSVFSQKSVYNEKISYTYFDKEWGEIPSMDGATYVRVFMGLDSIRPYYEVRDYTLSGALLSSIGSSSREYLKPEGPCTWYNDKRKPSRKGQYEKGEPAGQWTEFYYNGQIKVQYSFPSVLDQEGPDKPRRFIINSWDSTGQAEVVDGNGLYQERDDSTGVVIARGMTKNGHKDSTWQGFDENGEKIYEEEYAKGKFIQGKRLDVEGQPLPYDKLWEPPTYPGGTNALMKFLKKNLKYPRTAQERGVHGTVVVKFTINEDGSVTGTAIHAGVERSLNNEALRVARLLPAWTPGKERGKAEAAPFRLPISFSLQLSRKVAISSLPVPSSHRTYGSVYGGTSE